MNWICRKSGAFILIEDKDNNYELIAQIFVEKEGCPESKILENVKIILNGPKYVPPINLLSLSITEEIERCNSQIKKFLTEREKIEQKLAYELCPYHIGKLFIYKGIDLKFKKECKISKIRYKSEFQSGKHGYQICFDTQVEPNLPRYPGDVFNRLLKDGVFEEVLQENNVTA